MTADTMTMVDGVEQQNRDADHAASGVLQQISTVAQSGCSATEFYRQVFRVAAKHFRCRYALLNVSLGAAAIEDVFATSDRCPDDASSVAEAMVIEAKADQRAHVRVVADDGADSLAVLSAPVYAETGQVGVICMVTATEHREPQQLLTELVSIIAFIGAQHSAGNAGSNSSHRGVQRALEKATRFESVEEFAYSMVNNLAAKFDCEQVSFGVHRDRNVRLSAISGLDRFSPGSHGVMAIQQAMEECVDARETIHYQLSGGFGESSGTRSFLLHRQWHTMSNNAALLSVPLITTEGELTAVVSLLRASDKPFTANEIARVQELLQPFACVLVLLCRATRPPLQQLRECISSFWGTLRKPGWSGKKVFTVTSALLLAFFMFGWMPHRISVPCQVVPASINHVTSPFAATLKTVMVKDGDVVVAGQPIAKLDSRPLELERKRLQTEIASFRIEMDRALADGLPDEAAMADTRIKTTGSQLAIVEEQISQTSVVAPVDGVVIRGKLDQRIGQLLSFGDPLVEIAASSGMHVELQVPEDRAHFVTKGMEGQFAGFARPGDRQSIVVKSIKPASEVLDERNVFVVDAKMSGQPAWLKVGMEGTATVSAGWQPVWWLATHGLLNRIRMAVWL